jgi:hypothetical protein
MKKNIKVIFISVFFSLFLLSCYTHKGVSLNDEYYNNISYCKNAEYIATNYLVLGSSKTTYNIQKINGVTKVDTINKPFSFVNEYDLTIAKLLKEAKSQFGDDVTISNIRWDYINTKRYAATYDVIRCK